MRRLLIMLFMLTTLALPSLAEKPTHQAPRLPGQIKQALDRDFPGWKLAPVSPDVLSLFHEEKPGFEPDVLHGDFDGDGRPDWAVQILERSDNSEKRTVIVFLNQGTGYKAVRLESGHPHPGVYLWLFRKGDTDVDARTDALFHYTMDTIGVQSAGASVSYVYRDGRFTPRWTGA